MYFEVKTNPSTKQTHVETIEEERGAPIKQFFCGLCPKQYSMPCLLERHMLSHTREKPLSHYANMSVQYTAIFHGCKNDNFQMKFFDIFLIFAQNIDCEAVLTSTHNLCFGAKIKKICIPE